MKPISFIFSRVLATLALFSLLLPGICLAASGDCRLKAGTIIQATAAVCAEAGGQMVSSSGNRPPDDDVYSLWQTNRRTSPEAAYKAGNSFLATYPADSRAASVKAWVNAYEKVVNSRTPSPASGGNSEANREDNGQSLEESKRWVEKFLNKELANSYRSQKTVAKFQGCLLKAQVSVKANVRGFFSDSTELGIFEYEIPFEQLNPAGISVQKGYYSVGETDGAVLFSTMDKERNITVKKFKNAGTYNRPVNGAPVTKHEFIEYYRRVATGGSTSSLSLLYLGSGKVYSSLLFVDSNSSALRLTKAFKDIAWGCGAKEDTY